MPELPEVETIRRGIEPHVAGRRVESVTIRDRRLRWPVPADLPERLRHQRIRSVRRRAKYLLLDTESGSAMIHLGMSGRLQVVAGGHPVRKHDHADIVLDSGDVLRFHDPRRFGSILWASDPARHPLLASLGPEPFDAAFGGDHLYRLSRGRRIAIKAFIMNAAIVVGVGNIYASEALFRAGIHPTRPAGRISALRMAALAGAIRQVLERAIEAGGTTLRDFYGGDGSPGYFQQELAAYGRTGEPCLRCGAPIRQKVVGQRSTFYCAACQR
jgi:formamidopyrimidine-DNA glycosylase